MNKILVEKLNNNDDSYTVYDLIKNQSEVKRGDLLFSLDTSKALIEIESDYDGFILVNPNMTNGTSVVVGDIVAVISNTKITSFDFSFDKTESNEANPSNFTKSAYKYAIENNLSISEFSSEEIVTLDMLKSKN